MKQVLFAAMVATAAAAPALAGPYRDFPAPEPYPFERSIPVAGPIAIPPYDHPFGVRVYATPPHEPYHNVPPYAVVVPY